MSENFNLVISEPWNFLGVDGTNKVAGKIIKRVGKRCCVFQSSGSVQFANVKGRLFVLFPRYAEDSFAGGLIGISVNVGLLRLNDYEDLDEKSLEANSQFAFIGSLEDSHNS